MVLAHCERASASSYHANYEAYNDANARGGDDLEANPLAGRRVRLEEGHEPEANKHEYPANVVCGAVLVRCLDDYTKDDCERRDNKRSREDVHTRTDRRRRHACLEIHGEVIYKVSLTREHPQDGQKYLQIMAMLVMPWKNVEIYLERARMRIRDTKARQMCNAPTKTGSVRKDVERERGFLRH